jgi:hypothetical protein
VLATGVIVFLIGFALLIPRGGSTGAVAHRNVTMANSQLFGTRGYEGVQSNRVRNIRIGVAVVLIAGGVVMMITGS